MSWDGWGLASQAATAEDRLAKVVGRGVEVEWGGCGEEKDWGEDYDNGDKPL